MTKIGLRVIDTKNRNNTIEDAFPLNLICLILPVVTGKYRRKKGLKIKQTLNVKLIYNPVFSLILICQQLMVDFTHKKGEGKIKEMIANNG